MKAPKYKYIFNWVCVPANENSYNAFAIVDTQSGRVLRGIHVPESNLRAVIFELNGKNHRQNYWYTTTQLSLREYKYYTEGVEYIGCQPAEIAAAFRKMMRSRKRKA